MPTVYLSPLFNGWQGLGSSLVLLNAGQINTYGAGGSTPVATYTTSTGNVQNANPIILNSDGRPPAEIWLTGGQAYKFVLTDSLLNTLGTYDNIYGIGDPFAANSQTGPINLTGAAGTNTITANGPTGVTYATGQTYVLTPANTNTGAMTLNVTPSGGTALGAKNVFLNGAACVGNELFANVPAILEYDGTQFNIMGNGSKSLLYAASTWTPVLTFATPGDLAVTYSVQTGTYTKIGRKVFISCVIQTSAFTFTTASGALRITGLPFTSLTSAGQSWWGPCGWQGITKANYTDINATVASNAALVTLNASGSGQAAAAIATGDVPSGGSVIIDFSLTYEAAS